MLLLRIIEKLLIIYFALYLVIDIFLYLSAFTIFIRRKKRNTVNQSDLNNNEPFVSVVVPAYNEDVSIVVCTKMLLDLNYRNYQVIVVNDGSRDNTLKVMLDNFTWENQNHLLKLRALFTLLK